MEEILTIIGSILGTTIRVAIPIAFASVGAVYSERAGIINLGLEGMMVVGAFFAVLGSYLTGSALIGLLFAIVASSLVAALHALVTIKFKTDHIISSLAINLFGTGITSILLMAVWQSQGKTTSVNGLGTINIDMLANIPILSEIFGTASPLLYLLLIVVLGSWFILYKTVWGLRIRTIGENPQVADTLGINVYKMQYTAVILSGALAGIGGAYLSIGDLDLFSQGMVAGRGYIALAATIFGAWNPLGAFAGSIFFGLAESLQMRIQWLELPSQFVRMIPYVATLFFLILSKKGKKGPAFSGKHYYR